MNNLILNDKEFKVFQKIIFDETGISLSDSKKMLVQSRLLKRIAFYKMNSFVDYLRYIQINKKEKIEMINQITTNETYFFREMKHFEFIEKLVKNMDIKSRLRIWSAASSVGAEAYSLAMVVDEYLRKDQWEIVGTDINTEVIKKARIGLYPESWVKKIPLKYRQKYCLKGKGNYEGEFLVDRKLITNIKFEKGNLLVKQEGIGKFDVIFLRNVLIYFNDEVKKQVIYNVLSNLKVGGYFIISLTEHLKNLNIKELVQLDSSIYQKVSE
jgi:chemotaxis protein methyltransferase CheR